MRALHLAVMVAWLGLPSAATAQERDGATWVRLAREAMADARYDTAAIDLDHADDAPPSPELSGEIADARAELSAARTSAPAPAPAHEGWTHGLSMGLYGGAAFAAGTAIAFGVLTAEAGLFHPPCVDYCFGVTGDAFFGSALASGISMLALFTVATWLALDGPSIQGGATNDGFWLSASGRF